METHFFPWEPAQDLVMNYEFLQKKKSCISQLLFVAQHCRQNGVLTIMLRHKKKLGVPQPSTTRLDVNYRNLAVAVLTSHLDTILSPSLLHLESLSDGILCCHQMFLKECVPQDFLQSCLVHPPRGFLHLQNRGCVSLRKKTMFGRICKSFIS